MNWWDVENNDSIEVDPDLADWLKGRDTAKATPTKSELGLIVLSEERRKSLLAKAMENPYIQAFLGILGDQDGE